MRYVWPVLGVLCALQMLEGTQLLTSLAYCAFVVVIVDAFNTVGGMIYPSGAYIFYGGLLTLIIGGIAKTALGEPLDSNLFNAQKSILIYLTGACSIWLAAKINVRVRRKSALLAPLQLLPDRIRQVALGAAIFGQFGGILIPTAVLSTFNQLNVFPALSLFLFSYGMARKTDGYRTFSIISFVVWSWTTITWGLLAFSKEGMFRPALAWALGAVIAGYRVTWKRAICIGVGTLVGVTLMTPVAQVGRVYRGEAISDQMAWDLVTHPLRTREQYNRQMAEVMKAGGGGYHWFDQSQGLFDRLTMLPIDDALIHATDNGHSPGLLPTQQFLINMIPRYLVSSKETLHWGNRYAHEIGMLGAKDFITGVSFSPFGDAYHEMQWWGVTLLAFPLFLFMFVFCDSLTGSTKETIWASIYVLLFAHASAEGMLATPFVATSTNAAMILFAALVSRYVLPLIGGLFMLPEKQTAMPVVLKPWRPASGYQVRALPRTIEEKL